MRYGILAAAICLAAAGGGTAIWTRAEAAATQPAKVAPALDFSAKDIDGQEVALGRYQGDVILVVNVASKCGNTPQYEALEKLYEKHKEKGFTVLGFPANNFNQQEPGTNEQIKVFCTDTYHVTFPMFAKISVKGEDTAPLYKYLTAQKTAPQPEGAITWNFEKFVMGRDGSVVARFAPKTKPDDPAVLAILERELAKPKP